MEDPYEINKSILKDPIEIPDNANESFPSNLTDLILKLLDRDMSSRLTNMGEIMKDPFF